MKAKLDHTLYKIYKFLSIIDGYFIQSRLLIYFFMVFYHVQTISIAITKNTDNENDSSLFNTTLMKIISKCNLNALFYYITDGNNSTQLYIYLGVIFFTLLTTFIFYILTSLFSSTIIQNCQSLKLLVSLISIIQVSWNFIWLLPALEFYFNQFFYNANNNLVQNDVDNLVNIILAIFGLICTLIYSLFILNLKPLAKIYPLEGTDILDDRFSSVDFLRWIEIICIIIWIKVMKTINCEEINIFIIFFCGLLRSIIYFREMNYVDKSVSILYGYLTFLLIPCSISTLLHTRFDYSETYAMSIFMIIIFTGLIYKNAYEYLIKLPFECDNYLKMTPVFFDFAIRQLYLAIKNPLIYQKTVGENLLQSFYIIIFLKKHMNKCNIQSCPCHNTRTNKEYQVKDNIDFLLLNNDKNIKSQFSPVDFIDKIPATIIHSKLILQIINQMYTNYIQNQDKNSRFNKAISLKIMHCMFIYHEMKGFITAFVKLAQLKSNETFNRASYKEKLLINNLDNLLEKDFQKTKSSKEILDFKLVIEFYEALDELKIILAEIFSHYIKFYTEIANSPIDLDKIIKISTKLINLRAKTSILTKKLLGIYSYNDELIKIVQKIINLDIFEYETTRQIELKYKIAQQFEEKFHDNIIKLENLSNKKISRQSLHTIKLHNLFGKNAGIIFASLNILKLGVIRGITPNIVDLFGYYNKNDLIDTDIKILMPKVYAEKHDQYLLDFIKTSEYKKIKENINTQFAVSNTGFIFPILVKLKLEIYKDEICTTALIHAFEKSTQKICYLMVDYDGYILEYNERFYSYFLERNIMSQSNTTEFDNIKSDIYLTKNCKILQNLNLSFVIPRILGVYLSKDDDDIARLFEKHIDYNESNYISSNEDKKNLHRFTLQKQDSKIPNENFNEICYLILPKDDAFINKIKSNTAKTILASLDIQDIIKKLGLKANDIPPRSLYKLKLVNSSLDIYQEYTIHNTKIYKVNIACQTKSSKNDLTIEIISITKPKYIKNMEKCQKILSDTKEFIKSSLELIIQIINGMDVTEFKRILSKSSNHLTTDDNDNPLLKHNNNTNNNNNNITKQNPHIHISDQSIIAINQNDDNISMRDYSSTFAMLQHKLKVNTKDITTENPTFKTNEEEFLLEKEQSNQKSHPLSVFNKKKNEIHSPNNMSNLINLQKNLSSSESGIEKKIFLLKTFSQSKTLSHLKYNLINKKPGPKSNELNKCFKDVNGSLIPIIENPSINNNNTGDLSKEIFFEKKQNASRGKLFTQEIKLLSDECLYTNNNNLYQKLIDNSNPQINQINQNELPSVSFETCNNSESIYLSDQLLKINRNINKLEKNFIPPNNEKTNEVIIDPPLKNTDIVKNTFEIVNDDQNKSPILEIPSTISVKPTQIFNYAKVDDHDTKLVLAFHKIKQFLQFGKPIIAYKDETKLYNENDRLANNNRKKQIKKEKRVDFGSQIDILGNKNNLSNLQDPILLKKNSGSTNQTKSTGYIAIYRKLLLDNRAPALLQKLNLFGWLSILTIITLITILCTIFDFIIHDYLDFVNTADFTCPFTFALSMYHKEIEKSQMVIDNLWYYGEENLAQMQNRSTYFLMYSFDLYKTAFLDKSLNQDLQGISRNFKYSNYQMKLIQNYSNSKYDTTIIGFMHALPHALNYMDIVHNYNLTELYYDSETKNFFLYNYPEYFKVLAIATAELFQDLYGKSQVINVTEFSQVVLVICLTISFMLLVGIYPIFRIIESKKDYGLTLLNTFQLEVLEQRIIFMKMAKSFFSQSTTENNKECLQLPQGIISNEAFNPKTTLKRANKLETIMYNIQEKKTLFQSSKTGNKTFKDREFEARSNSLNINLKKSKKNNKKDISKIKRKSFRDVKKVKVSTIALVSILGLFFLVITAFFVSLSVVMEKKNKHFLALTYEYDLMTDAWSFVPAIYVVAYRMLNLYNVTNYETKQNIFSNYNYIVMRLNGRLQDCIYWRENLPEYLSNPDISDEYKASIAALFNANLCDFMEMNAFDYKRCLSLVQGNMKLGWTGIYQQIQSTLWSYANKVLEANPPYDINIAKQIIQTQNFDEMDILLDYINLILERYYRLLNHELTRNLSNQKANGRIFMGVGITTMILILIFGWMPFIAKIKRDFFFVKKLYSIIPIEMLVLNNYVKKFLRENSESLIQQSIMMK